MLLPLKKSWTGLIFCAMVVSLSLIISIFIHIALLIVAFQHCAKLASHASILSCTSLHNGLSAASYGGGERDHMAWER